METTVHLKIKVDRAELPRLINSSPFAGTPLRKDQRAVTNSGGPRWWNPDSVGQFTSGSIKIQGNGSDNLSILISLDDPEHAFVFLTWFDM